MVRVINEVVEADAHGQLAYPASPHDVAPGARAVDHARDGYVTVRQFDCIRSVGGDFEWLRHHP